MNILKSQIKKAIEKHISPMKLIGDVSKHEDEWRALVAPTSVGPLLLMGFRIKTEGANNGTDLSGGSNLTEV
jgi:hypothetical protein